MMISGIKGAVEFCKYISQNSGTGGATFADALVKAADADKKASIGKFDSPLGGG